MTSLDWDGLLEAIMEWAEGTDLVRGVILTGSRARADRPADEWSDLDLVLVCTDRAPLIWSSRSENREGVPRTHFQHHSGRHISVTPRTRKRRFSPWPSSSPWR